ncbi:MAG: CvpA family protein [Proteobacteria bacterium]|uniref:CvpA family protein n=1 Tax=Aquabacterium sp. TaxID=1872578 RepID=UPI0035C6CA4B|nr:CvpA family protein [Pseudomonadota bacterium]
MPPTVEAITQVVQVAQVAQLAPLAQASQASAVGAGLPAAWTLLDLLLAVGLGVSVLVGIWRGLLTEVLALLGWAVAYIASQYLGADAGQHVPVGAPGSRVNVLAGMVVVFALTWLVWAVLSWGMREILKASGLSGTDRLLGAVFGLMRGLVVALVVVTLVQMTPLAQSELWRSSRSVGWMQTLLQGLRPILPDQVLQFLPEPGPT